jgi:hypothetical protein
MHKCRRTRRTRARPNGAEQPHVHALVQAVEGLREQLAVANRRIDELTTERRRLTALLIDRVPWWRRWLR